MNASQEAIDRLIRQIVEVVHPLRIVVFGSAARGDMSCDSDIDVLVVVPDGSHRRKTAQRLYKEVGNVGVPFDVVVATPMDLEKHKDNVGLVYKSVLREGKEVYVA